MQIFVKKPEGKTVTVDVESYEKISSVKRRLEDKEGICSGLQRLFYAGKLLEDGRSFAYYNISRESTLLLLLRPRMLPHIYVKIEGGKLIPLRFPGLNTIDDVKATIYEKKGIPPDRQCLFFGHRPLEGNQTLSQNHIEPQSILLLRVAGTNQLNVKSSGRAYEQAPPHDSVNRRNRRARSATRNIPSSSHANSSGTKITPPPAPRQTKRARPATQTKATPNITETNDGEVCAEYIKGLATCADRQAMSQNNYDAKLKLFALHQAKATAALSDLMPEFEARPPSSVLTELEDLKREMATALTKEKELLATISGLTYKNNAFSAQVVALEAENKKIKDKEKEQEATIFRLTRMNKELSAQHASNRAQLVALGAENKKTKDKEMEQEATIARLTHKNKVFSAQCAAYESQVIALEAEYKKTKEDLMNADKKHYSGARAAGYAEGLKEGKAKWLKSVEFLHHLTDASMQYLEYGFESCQKQAEQQGFVGQLNKDFALKEAPQLEGWESSALTE